MGVFYRRGMPFPKEIAQWWRRVTSDKCAMPVYTENNGFRLCGRPAEQVHHIRPESVCLIDGDNPNATTGIPLCKPHHVGVGGGVEYEQNFSIHPDMGQAAQDYWKDKESFAKAAKKHVEQWEQGERFWGGEESFDNVLSGIMTNLAVAYLAHHPEDPKPEAKPHKKMRHKKHWTDEFFDGDS